MTISARQWRRYIDALRTVNNKAAELVLTYLRTHGMPADRTALNALIDYAFAVTQKYAAAAATLSAEMYDAIAIASGELIEAAIVAEMPTIADVAKAVVGTVKTGNEEIVSGAVGRLVKQTGVDTTMQNALRDGAWWAWIPSGDTCAFCVTLASRGWQKASRKAIKNGHAEHIHANCDCTYAVRFSPFDEVEGYDPDKYLEMYEDADGTKPQDKINSMRREAYQKNKIEINAQKRDNYEKRQERESSAAEEIDV